MIAIRNSAAQLKKLGDLFGKASRAQLTQVNVSEIDRIQIDRGLEFIGDIDGRIKQSEATIRATTKTNGSVKLLKTIPWIGDFFARLVMPRSTTSAASVILRSWPPMLGLVPSTYSSGGKRGNRATLGICRPQQRADNGAGRAPTAVAASTIG